MEPSWPITPFRLGRGCGWRKNRWPLLRFGLLLHLDLRNEDAGGDGGHGHRTRFGTASAIEDGKLVVGGDDIAECREGCANEIDTAHEFLPSVRKNTVDHDGQHVEAVGDHPTGDGEPALDILEDQAE